MTDEAATVVDGAGAPQTMVKGSRTPASTPDAEHIKPNVAGYEIVRLLGVGGMGVVWEAIEQRLERSVALKVRRANIPAERGEDDLWAEALVAARIGDPSIVRILDVGLTIVGERYYTMDLVKGTDLRTLFADGQILPRTAVALAADIARAAAAAHEHGVIHRDLKPANVLVDATGRARILDFGLAFDLVRGDRFEGTFAGSPPYMSPEQVRGDAMSGQSDVFSIGVILYEMLTGKRPFARGSLDDTLQAVLTFDPPPPSTTRDGIHRDLDAIVARCIAKSTDERFQSAGALYETLAAVAEGKAIEVARPRPARPTPTQPLAHDKPRREDATKKMVWSWHLKSERNALWPYVADTDRFNKAVGLGPVAFTDTVKGEGVVERTGQFRVLAFNIKWREAPFEWVRGREHSVFRSYTAGPLSALWNRVSMTSLPGGGTELRHEISVSPRGVLGHVAAFLEIERKLGPAIDRFYRRLDDLLVSGADGDPFDSPHQPTRAQRAFVDECAERLTSDGFETSLVDRFLRHILYAPDAVASTLRPYELADTWGIERESALDLMLHASNVGLLEPVWDVICPKCMIAHESLGDLVDLKRHGTCTACATSFERDLRESVELVFAPHPSIRAIVRATYCAGAPAKRPHIIAQQVLAPGEERRVIIDVPRGAYQVTAAVARGTLEVVASAVGVEDTCEVTSTQRALEGRPLMVGAGQVTFAFRNDGDIEDTFRIENPEARANAVWASSALTHPVFRELFSEQVLAHGEHVRVRHLAFVFVEMAAREKLFTRVGDDAAYVEVNKLDELITEVSRAHDGHVVPSSLGIAIVGFATRPLAVAAALALRVRCLEGTLGASVAIAVHDGRCIALTRSGVVEFFGETLHRGQALLVDCPPRGIVLSSATASDRAVGVAIHESGLSISVEKARGGAYAGRRITVVMPEP